MRSVKKSKSIHFIVPAEVGISPGQRFRFEHYLPILRERGFIIKISPFFSISQWRTLYKHGKQLNKLFAVVGGVFNRLFNTVQSLKYDYVFIYREATPLGPPIFEWFLYKVLRKKIIYDFDDAIWLPQTSVYNKNILALKWYSKISMICKWSYKTSVGNEFLKQFAQNYSNSVSIIPTVVDTRNTHNRLQEHNTTNLAVGWTGTFSTLKYLEIVLPAIAFLQLKYQFKFYVIADTDPKLELKNYMFIKWNKETEISDILRFHIGIMPLTDDDISKGKCGFKAIQYMSLGIPAVASPVGVNCNIIDDGVNGFLCNEMEDWIKSIELLLTNQQLRENMGINARSKIETFYSVDSTTEQFIQLFS